MAAVNRPAGQRRRRPGLPAQIRLPHRLAGRDRAAQDQQFDYRDGRLFDPGSRSGHVLADDQRGADGRTNR
jgi:hypothetical protein